MELWADVGQQETVGLGLLAPSVVGRGAHVSAVISRALVVIGVGTRLFHLFIFGEGASLALEGAVGVVGCEMPSHPVGQPKFMIVRGSVPRTVQYLLGPVCEWRRQQCARVFNLGLLLWRVVHQPSCQSLVVSGQIASSQ